MSSCSKHGGVVSAGTAAYHRDVAVARQRIQEEDAGRLPPGGATPGGTVAEDLLGGEGGEPEIIRMALARIDWPPDDPRWYQKLRGPLAFWSHVPWIVSPKWTLDRGGYLASFRLILARTHANRKVLGRTILTTSWPWAITTACPGGSPRTRRCFAATLLDAGARTDVRRPPEHAARWACRWDARRSSGSFDRGVDPVEPDASRGRAARVGEEGHREIVRMLREQPRHGRASDRPAS